MRDRLLQYLAAALIALVFVLLLLALGVLSEGNTGPSGETGCPDRVCNEQIDIDESREGR